MGSQTLLFSDHCSRHQSLGLLGHHWFHSQDHCWCRQTRHCCLIRAYHLAVEVVQILLLAVVVAQSRLAVDSEPHLAVVVRNFLLLVAVRIHPVVDSELLLAVVAQSLLLVADSEPHLTVPVQSLQVIA